MSPASPSSCFSLENVSISYGTNLAVRGVYMEIPRGKVTAFIGPSGCGKSTVLRSLNRMNDLIEGCTLKGSVKFENQDLYTRDVDAVEVRRRIGMVFQKPNPFPKSIYENIAFGARINGFRGDMDELVERSLRRSLAMYDGDITMFAHNPLAASMLGLTAIVLMVSGVLRLRRLL